MRYFLVPPDDATPFWDGCPACRGTGLRGRGKCSVCAGAGKLECTPWAKMIFVGRQRRQSAAVPSDQRTGLDHEGGAA